MFLAIGCLPSPSNVTNSLRNGTVIDTAQVPSLGALDLHAVTFTVDLKDGEIYCITSNYADDNLGNDTGKELQLTKGGCMVTLALSETIRKQLRKLCQSRALFFQ